MNKKLKKSPIVIICYVLAAVLLIYSIYQGSTVAKQISEYYASMGMSAKAGEYVTYILQSIMQPLMYSILLFMSACILAAVRKLDPSNYVEAAVKDVAGKTAVESEFTKSLDAEMKKDTKTTGSSRTASAPKSGSKTTATSKSGTRKTSGSKSSAKKTSGGRKPAAGKTAKDTKDTANKAVKEEKKTAGKAASEAKKTVSEAKEKTEAATEKAGE